MSWQRGCYEVEASLDCKSERVLKKKENQRNFDNLRNFLLFFLSPIFFLFFLTFSFLASLEPPV